MNMLTMKISSIKSIKEFQISLPLQQGLYAITGENGSGKSTILACLATSFYNPMMYSYFGSPYPGSEIKFEIDSKIRIITSYSKKLLWNNAKGKLGITGFYEGSLIYGNRFKDVDFNNLKKLASIKKDDLIPASGFIKSNMGKILHDDENYYDNLFLLKEESSSRMGLIKQPYYYEVNNRLINQLSMSTGENLLLTILQSLEIRISKANRGLLPTLVLLDEIELALHSSALRRLVFFLRELTQQYNFSVYFSTHSIELIRGIAPENIFYLQRYVDGSLNTITPCYPVYATRNLESSNSGHDFVIMVEDNLAKNIVENILYKEKLLANKRVLVIAVGGWTEVIRFAYDTIRSNLTLSTTKILVVLDKDIKEESKRFMKNEKIGFTTPPNYLPIKSLEKFLISNLVHVVDQNLHSKLDNYIFQRKSLTLITAEYKKNEKEKKYTDEKVKNGKAFFSDLQFELRSVRKEDKDLTDAVVDFLFEYKKSDIAELRDFLTNTLT